MILAYIIVFLLVPLHLLVDVTQTLRQKKDNILTDKNTKTKLKIQYHARNMYHYIDVTYSRFFMV